MISIHAHNSDYVPKISKSGLLDMPVQSLVDVNPGKFITIDLGYGLGLQDGVILDFIICGELRRAGLKLKDERHLHTCLHQPTESILVDVLNTSDQTITIKPGDHALHAIITNTNATIAND